MILYKLVFSFLFSPLKFSAEKARGLVLSLDQMDLPTGFRFHPTDEELISQYLYKKVTDTNFSSIAIGDVDLNRSEPWDLPCKYQKQKTKNPAYFNFWLKVATNLSVCCVSANVSQHHYSCPFSLVI